MTYKKAVNNVVNAITERFNCNNEQAFCFTSCISGQGITTILREVQLNLSKKYPNLKSVVVDANPDNTSFSEIFECTDRPGFSDMILKMDFKNASPSLPKESRNAIHFGTVKADIELISSTDYHNFICYLKTSKDIILIDGPVYHSGASDALSLLKACDSTFIVIGSGTVHLKSAQRVIEELNKHNCNVAGAVLNSFKMTIPEWLYKLT